jgi:hypothetical protein
MAIQNLNKILEARAAQLAQKTGQVKDKQELGVDELARALVALIDESNKIIVDMLRAIADNQKLLNAKIDRLLEQKGPDEKTTTT